MQVSRRVLAHLHLGSSSYITSDDAQGTWVPCSRLVSMSPGAASGGHSMLTLRVSMAPRAVPACGGVRRGVSFFPRSSVWSVVQVFLVPQALAVGRTRTIVRMKLPEFWNGRPTEVDFVSDTVIWDMRFSPLSPLFLNSVTVFRKDLAEVRGCVKT